MAITKKAGEELAMALQGDALWMTSLGLAEPDQVRQGVHLRWGVTPALGFPRTSPSATCWTPASPAFRS